ncbi:hypothetical protein [Paracidobacterium acidisoli]|uniref:D-ribose pyranase n=1 Tax=Paracidobacterium acidisoli TaxID=2303751 RepID=A0A372IN65_9BACT|nr:hypothetical protein [Paracidobacterium acidisoli]MBT9332069.1 hypothetical protein [Paracidobacterium acidisoli]
MFRNLLALAVFLAAPAVHAASTPDASAWKAKVTHAMPLLGHRNWILIVDSAYPLQTSPGVETIETGAGMTDALHFVLDTIRHSEHVRPDIYMDAELPFIPEQDAPGVSRYRRTMADILHSYKVESLPHDRIIANIDEAGKIFHILVLKTNLTIPYTSVFIRLNCRYWNDDAEARLREKMNAAGAR